MKLVRHGAKGQERPGMLDASGRVRDLGGRVADFAGAGVSFAALEAIRAIDPESLPLVPEGARLGACLADVPNFHCIGLNYARHAAETGATPPAEPILFQKATSALAGPFDPLPLPPDSGRLDWEVELGVVIGRPAWQVPLAEALSVVAGYCVVNDVSERDWQSHRGGTWSKGKSGPGFGPAGPWLVTADEIADPQALPLWLDLNGQRVQDSSTSDMIFSVAEIIAAMTRYMALRPGDIIATGTPEGVGLGMKPQRFLKAGDRLRLGVEGLGVQESVVTG